MNVIKYRLMKIKMSIDKKIKYNKKSIFTCSQCNKEFEEMEIYTNGYKCPNDDTQLDRKGQDVVFDPDQLRKESNNLFNVFQEALKQLEDFKIPREFFGLDPLKNPNFNLPDHIAISGFHGHLADIKVEPTVNVLFSTLKSDERMTDVSSIPKSKRKLKDYDHYLKYYLVKTKEKIAKEIKAAGKRSALKRRKKEVSKLMPDVEYQKAYKNHWAKMYDV